MDLGLQLLIEHGGSALTVERMCEAAKRTRGSFYHHFDDQRAFVATLVEEWRARQTLAVIRGVEAVREASDTSNAPDAHRTLRRLASGIDHRLDLAMRRWGFTDAAVGNAVAAVDAERLAYIADIYRAKGMDAAATRLAEAEYALFVGAQILWPDRTIEERIELKAVIGSG